MRRRLLLLAAGVAGCAADRAAVAPPAAARGDALLGPWRAVNGGFLAPPSVGVGLPARPTGMFVKFARPGAVALRGSELLVADLATSRLWRVDAVAGTVSGIAGAPVSAQTALALGPDLSAWVLDPPRGQVLRLGRDGRLLQTFRAGTAVPTPSALALADGGATLLLADGVGAQWSEQRSVGGFAQRVAPVHAGGARISGVDDLALGRSEIFVLDRLAGAVHRIRRDGQVLETLGRGELLQPTAIAADRHDRVFVVDEQGRALKLLQAGQAGQAVRRLDGQTLGVLQIGGIAIDGELLAIADALAGQVVILRLVAGAAP